MGAHFPAVELDNKIRFSEGSQLGPPVVVSFNICQGLKYWYLTPTPTLTMWLLFSSAPFLEPLSKVAVTFWVYSHRQIRNPGSTLLDPRPSVEFSRKMPTFFKITSWVSLRPWPSCVVIIWLICYLHGS